MASIVNMVDNSSIQNNPIRKVKEFIDKQNQYKSVGDIDHWRFVGYVLDISVAALVLCPRTAHSLCRNLLTTFAT